MEGMQNLMSPDMTLATLRKAEMDIQRKADLAKMSKGMDMQAIEKAAQDFEAMFITEMMKPMFEGIKPDPMFGGGKGEEMFQGIMLEEYGKVMAARGGVGIAEHVKAEMIRIQAEANSQRTEMTQENKEQTTEKTTE